MDTNYDIMIRTIYYYNYYYLNYTSDLKHCIQTQHDMRNNLKSNIP